MPQPAELLRHPGRTTRRAAHHMGRDLERAMSEAAPETGEKIGLPAYRRHPVTLPDGTETQRYAWKVRGAGELAYEQLERRLAAVWREETTLDYTRDFAERRGIAEQMLSVARSNAERAGLRAERESTAGDHALDRRSPQNPRGSRAGIFVQIREDLAGDRQQRRNPFEGLKLGAARRPRAVEPDRAGEDGPQIDQKRPQQAEQRRGMFAGLKLNARPVAGAHRAAGKGRELAAGAGARPAGRAGAGAACRLRRLLDRHSRAYESVAAPARGAAGFRHAAAGNARCRPAARPGAGRHERFDAPIVPQHDPATARAMTELSGRERVAQVIDGMKRENAALQDPNVRAERFVERWQELQGQRRAAVGSMTIAPRSKADEQLAKSLERDPQAESPCAIAAGSLNQQELRREQSIALRAVRRNDTRPPA